MIEIAVFDFDGVFTNGKFYFNDNDVYKCYNSKDAYSLKLLKNNNIKCAVITNDEVVSIENAVHIFSRLDMYSIGSNEPKLNILNKWLNELNISYENVAYMGDDLPDIPILKLTKLSSCPIDAVKDVKDICKYICKNKGGNGSVREFVEKILEYNISYTDSIKNITKNDGKITAIIPVRKGSVRCKNKNIRNFCDTNLLKLKICALKNIQEIDEIIVSSDCPQMLNLANDLGVKIHARPEYYSSSECQNHEYWKYIAESVGECDNFMMVNCVSPLINENIMNKFIKTYKENNYKNMVTVNDKYKFFCDTITKKEINFNLNKSLNSQSLKPLSEITFGLCISERKDIIETSCIFGKNPYFYKLDDIESIDIDNNNEFIVSELLFQNNITDTNIAKLIMDRRANKIEMIDCTIRDGGYLNNWNFTNKEIIDCYEIVSELNYDYFEIGFRSNEQLLPNKGKWCYSTENDINKIVEKYNGCKIAVMAKIGTVTIDDFIKKNMSNITMVRVLLGRSANNNNVITSRYTIGDLINAKEFCCKLIEYGYEVCINFGCGDLLDDEEINNIVHTFNNVKLKALYLADTYGGFNSKNIPTQLHKFYIELQKYNSDIKIGFHIHNNNGDGLEKVKVAIYHGCTMIDSSINGSGRGAGNLKTEEYICYRYGDHHNFKAIICPIAMYYTNIITKEYYNKNNVRQHIYYNIAGVLSLHPDYILEILSNFNMNAEEDIKIIFQINDYTIKNNARNYDKNLIKQLQKITAN